MTDPLRRNPGAQFAGGRGATIPQPVTDLVEFHAHSCPRIAATDVSMEFRRGGTGIRALSGVSIEAGNGEFVAVVGPSGCGKSTLLEILAGLQVPTAGAVHIDGADTTGRVGTVAYMPQKDLLLPWRSVLDNTILGLEISGRSRREARREAIRWFPRFGLEGFADHYPSTLSGGMRQRASLLRTFLSGRDVLVLDEPFGALDALTRAELQEWLIDIHAEFGKTIILVTHDPDEALYLSDRVYVMTHRPGTVSGVLDVPFRRPRAYASLVTSSTYMELKRALLDTLSQARKGIES